MDQRRIGSSIMTLIRAVTTDDLVIRLPIGDCRDQDGVVLMTELHQTGVLGPASRSGSRGFAHPIP